MKHKVTVTTRQQVSSFVIAAMAIPVAFDFRMSTGYEITMYNTDTTQIRTALNRCAIDVPIVGVVEAEPAEFLRYQVREVKSAVLLATVRTLTEALIFARAFPTRRQVYDTHRRSVIPHDEKGLAEYIASLPA